MNEFLQVVGFVALFLGTGATVGAAWVTTCHYWSERDELSDKQRDILRRLATLEAKKK